MASNLRLTDYVHFRSECLMTVVVMMTMIIIVSHDQYHHARLGLLETNEGCKRMRMRGCSLDYYLLIIKLLPT